MQCTQQALDYHHLLDYHSNLALILSAQVPLAQPGWPLQPMTGGLTPEDTSTPAVIYLIEANHGINFHHEVARTESPTPF